MSRIQPTCFAVAAAVLVVACGGSSSQGAPTPGPDPDPTPTPTPAHHVAELPPPEITRFEDAAVCEVQGAASLRILGTGFLTVAGAVPTITIGLTTAGRQASVVAAGCSPLQGPFVEGAVQVCTALDVAIPAGLVGGGAYTVSVKNPAQPGGVATGPSPLRVLASPTLLDVDPAEVHAADDTVVSFRAAVFSALQPQVHVSVHGSTASPTVIAARLAAPDRGQVTLAAGQLDPGVYDLSVTDGNGCVGVLPSALAVTDSMGEAGDP